MNVTDVQTTSDVYIIGEERFVRLTKPFQAVQAHALDVWKAKIGEEVAKIIADKAAKTGTKIHAVCQGIAAECMGEKATAIPKKYQKHGDLFRRWLDKNVLEVVLIEKLVVSKTLLLAGRLDLGYVLKSRPDGLTIGDIKTGRVKPIADIQMAGYWKLLEECEPKLVEKYPIVGRQILPVPRKVETKDVEKFQAIDCPDDADADWEIYLCMLKTWRYPKLQSMFNPELKKAKKKKE